MPRENCRKVSKIFLTIFDDFWRFLPCAKIVEKCRKTFWHFLTIFDVFWRGPFPPAPFAIRWYEMWHSWALLFGCENLLIKLQLEVPTRRPVHKRWIPNPSDSAAVCKIWKMTSQQKGIVFAFSNSRSSFHGSLPCYCFAKGSKRYMEIWVQAGMSGGIECKLSGPLRLRLQSWSRTRLRIAVPIAFLFRACFKRVLDTIAPLSRGWAAQAV